MKKILLGISLCALVLPNLQAQQKQSLMHSPLRLDNAKVDGTIGKEQFKNHKTKTRGGSLYIDYVDFVAAQEGISSTTLDANRSLYNMFPDSVVRYGAPNSGYGIQWKSIGQVLEPWADAIRNNTPAGEIVFGKTNSYTIDSVYIATSYVKKTAAVDTVILSFVHSGGANLPEYYFTGQSADFGVDTTRFLLQSFNAADFTKGPYQVNATGAPANMVVKRALTTADSSTFTPPNSYGIKYLGFAVNMTVPAGERASLSYTFKPGFTYAPGDTVGNNNQLLFLSYEPNGDNTFMPFYPTDRNMSSVVYKDSTGWYGDYIPTLAWTVGYGCEMHDIIWKVSCPTCYPEAVNDISDIVDVEMTPNPASNFVTLSLNLKETANTSVRFNNVLGQEVKSLNLGTLSAGTSHKSTINVADLSKGLYLYTVEANGARYTGKLMVK
ncbi:MAG TPA: T9SS type A sorting domain-containing protein [Chitinophagaceae bacterium]|nr:T9SS type A sorting domain-containing protein [Chitinophagaceae bacterium]HNF70860.1 T9SS type A sorting domain-containing protein [Chitinophagaceae bacterium]